MTAQVRLVLVLVCCVWYSWLLGPTLCEQALTQWQQKRIQDFAKHVMSCGRIPGLSLSVVRGAHSWTLPLGVADLSSQVPIQIETRFAIGSLTKAMTSTLLVSLLMRTREWTVDTPLATILENPQLFADDVRSKQATIKDILSHRLGLVRADLALFAGYPDNFSLANVISGLACLPEQKPFRSGYAYSNILYSLAGHVVERLTNKSFEDALRSDFLDPLGMSSTGPYHDPGSQESRDDTKGSRPGEKSNSITTPYVFLRDRLVPADPRLFRNLEPFLPALGLASNGPDMVRWMRLQLGTGSGVSSVQRESLFPRSVISATHEPVTPHIVNRLRPRFPQPDLTFAYGLGWQQAVYKGFRRAWHSGSLFGFTSQIWLFQDLGLGLFVAVNGPAQSPQTQNKLTALLFYVTDLLLDHTPWLNEASACSYPSPPPGVSRPVSEHSARQQQSSRRPRNSRRSRSELVKNDQMSKFIQQPATGSLWMSSYSPSFKRTASYLSSSPPTSTSSSPSTPPSKSPERSESVGVSLSSLLSSLTANNSVKLKTFHKENNAVSTKQISSSITFNAPSVSHCPMNVSLQAKDLQRYQGVYINKLFGKVSVTYDIPPSWDKTQQRTNDTSVRNSDESLESRSDDEKPCLTKSNFKGWFSSNLQILFGERFSGILVYSERKQNLTDVSKSSVHSFQMIPTGIFEFSAHSDEEYITMPVLFTDFKSNGVPNLLKAIWQKEEVLEFSRDPYRQKCGLQRLQSISHSNASQPNIFTNKVLTLPITVLILFFVYLCL